MAGANCRLCVRAQIPLRLDLPVFVVLASMLGGVAVFGAKGALLGRLLVRLAVESLEIVTDRRREELGRSAEVAGRNGGEHGSLGPEGTAPAERPGGSRVRVSPVLAVCGFVVYQGVSVLFNR